jgi:TIR domain
MVQDRSEGYIFISYAPHDRAFVDRLSADLRNAGVQVWRDQEAILPGTNWQEEIQRGLAGAEAFLYVSSSNTADHQWSKAEVRYFLARGKKVIPLILDDEGARLPWDLAHIQWVDFRGDYQSALSLLVELLPRSLQQERPVEEPEQKSKGYVFISYAEEDADVIGPLKEFLKEKEYAYWDYQESDRDYQQDLYLELEGVIQEAAGTLSVLSPAWKRSQTTIKEFHFSREVGTPVFLLKVRELGPTLVIAGRPVYRSHARSGRGIS